MPTTDKIGNTIEDEEEEVDVQYDAGDASETTGNRLPAKRVARNKALHTAAAGGDMERCRLLLDGEDPAYPASNATGDYDNDDDSNYSDDGIADAWWQDDSFLRWSALHFAANGGHTDVVRLLLQCGGVWNLIDETGLTAGDIAWSLNDEETYRVLFEEGVRKTLILNLVNRQGHANSTSRTPALSLNNATVLMEDERNSSEVVAPTMLTDEVSAQNDLYLASPLKFVRDNEGKMRCLDQDGGLVMAAWETDVMERTAKLLCDVHPASQKGLCVLNVGFGLGIVDECLQRYKPTRHVIVEAHPDAIAFAKQNGWHTRPGVEIIPKRWEDALEDLRGYKFDVVYWDTYAQNYGELRDFVEEVPSLLAGPDARFSFFHGLAGTNRFFYDVYTRVAELDMRMIGMDTTWHEVRPCTTSETWNGVLRKYWDLDVLLIPITRLINGGGDDEKKD